MNLEYQNHSMNETELDSYQGMVYKHCTVTLMPNHCITRNGQLHGFRFATNPANMSRVLPLNSRLFECVCMFEVNSNDDEMFNPEVLRLINDSEFAQNALNDVMDDVRSDTMEEATLDCVTERQEGVGVLQVFSKNQDSRHWKPSVPTRIGLYHAFVQNRQTCKREHKLYIIIRGSLPSVSEEIYNLWHDSKSHITCGEFVACEELRWARDAVVRNHARIAALISRRLHFQVNYSTDYDLPDSTCTDIVKPTTVTFINDIQLNKDRNLVEYVCGACFTDSSRNGILFDTLGVDGYWLFCGPNLKNGVARYGSEMHLRFPYCLPTTCAFFTSTSRPGLLTSTNSQDQEVHLPTEKTLQIIEQCGFNRNDHIVFLMTIYSVETPEV